MKSYNILKENIELSKLSAHDIHTLLWEIENYYLDYKPLLNLDFWFQFGIELEYGKSVQKDVTKELRRLYKGRAIKSKNGTYWLSKDDKTVHQINGKIITGGEVVSPILTNETKTWQEIDLICKTLTELGAVAREETSTHIHIDQSILGFDPKVWIKFIKLWIIYEEVIYRFLFGEYPVGRKEISKYAKPVRTEYLRRLQKDIKDDISLDTLIIKLKLGRHYGINFMNTNTSNASFKSKNTIELRIPNGTLESVIIQNNILFFSSLLHAAQRVSEEFLNRKLNEINPNIEGNPNNIYIYEALELADLLFDNIEYKMCFLRQYIKSYEISAQYQKVENFIKRERSKKAV